MEQASNRQRQVPLVTHIFPTFGVGGAQVRFAAIANHFGRTFRHLVVALDGNLDCRERLNPDLDVNFPRIEVTKGAMLASAWRFRQLLRQWQPDVLVTCNWGAIEFALANLLPLTRHLHVVDGFGPEERSIQIPRRVITRRIVLRRSPVVLPSRSLVRIATEVWKLPPKVIHYIPNGIDIDRFAAPAARDTQRSLTVGTIAALREEKNIGRLLRAFASLTHSAERTPPLGLVIVGDGPARRGLEALAHELGIAAQVTFAGHRLDTPDFYRRFDIFALSSDTEQMPLSVIEAMAAGLPVVSTDVGDVRAMVSAPNGPFVTALDDAAMAAALRTLMIEPLLRQSVGDANRVKATRDFDQAAMFQAHGTLWRGTPAVA